eukprot:jgi/Mesen1/3172/ME000184S02231
MAQIAMLSGACLSSPVALSLRNSTFSGEQLTFSSKASPSVTLRSGRVTRCSNEDSSSSFSLVSSKPLQTLFCGACTALALTFATPSLAAQPRLPPLSQDPLRCEKAFVGNTIGQANGVADKLLDLRFCDFSNDKTNLKGKTLSAALMADANFDGADLTEVVMSKAYAANASFKGTIFTNAVIDRVIFDKADLTGAQFINTVLSGSTFDGANLKDANFEDALIGYVDIQKICRNDTLPEEARGLLGCK